MRSGRAVRARRESTPRTEGAPAPATCAHSPPCCQAPSSSTSCDRLGEPEARRVAEGEAEGRGYKVALRQDEASPRRDLGAQAGQRGLVGVAPRERFCPSLWALALSP